MRSSHIVEKYCLHLFCDPLLRSVCANRSSALHSWKDKPVHVAQLGAKGANEIAPWHLSVVHTTSQPWHLCFASNVSLFYDSLLFSVVTDSRNVCCCNAEKKQRNFQFGIGGCCTQMQSRHSKQRKSCLVRTHTNTTECLLFSSSL